MYLPILRPAGILAALLLALTPLTAQVKPTTGYKPATSVSTVKTQIPAATSTVQDKPVSVQTRIPTDQVMLKTDPAALTKAATVRPVLSKQQAAIQYYDAAVKVNPENLYIMPYIPPRATPGTAAPATPAAPNTTVQGPNVTLGRDLNILMGEPQFAFFIHKLNIFREVYEDKNPNSGQWYYLPSAYNLKWTRDGGQYSFYIYYLSAGDQGRGDVIITAELTPDINRQDIEAAEKILSAKQGKPVHLLPMPLKDTPKVQFGNALRNFDVEDQSVSTNVPTDYLQPIVVSWRMGSRVDDFVGAMMNNIGLSGNVDFAPFSETERLISVPVKLKINDPLTYGKIEYSEASRLLNGFQNQMDYPISLNQLLVLRERPNKTLALENISLGNYEVQPGQFFSSFSETERNHLLEGDLIKKIWVDYAVKPCSTCNQTVQSKILGGTAGSRVQNIEIQSLTPISFSKANSLKVLIKSKQGDPNGEQEVLLPIVTVREDGVNYPGGDLFIPDGQMPAFVYQLVLIKADGEVLTSEWIEGSDYFVIVGESAIRQHFPGVGE